MSSAGPHAPPLPALDAPPSFLRERRYGEDRLYLLVRDPHRALAVWELTPATHRRARTPAYQIRIERRQDERAAAETILRVEIPDALGGDRWYVTLPRSGGWCRARLGVADGGDFQALLESGWVPVPPDGPCAEEGTWDLTPEARAWLEARARAARGFPAPPSSAARYGQGG
jgi:hypothetical protein